jgi:hypothetical protein
MTCGLGGGHEDDVSVPAQEDYQRIIDGAAAGLSS